MLDGEKEDEAKSKPNCFFFALCEQKNFTTTVTLELFFSYSHDY